MLEGDHAEYQYGAALLRGMSDPSPSCERERERKKERKRSISASHFVS